MIASMYWDMHLVCNPSERDTNNPIVAACTYLTFITRAIDVFVFDDTVKLKVFILLLIRDTRQPFCPICRGGDCLVSCANNAPALYWRTLDHHF